MGTGATLAGPMPAKAGPRTFWVRVPADYDPRHAYRVVYMGQGCGGLGVANTTTYPLYQEASGGNEEAIYVALDIPTDRANLDCYDTAAGPSSQEWEAFELIHAVVDATYCVDNDQIFVSGYSSGGYVANMWGCYFAGDGAHPWNGVPGGGGAGAAPRRFAPRYHVRGQASVGAGEPPNDPPCNGPVAGLWIEDTTDEHTPPADTSAGLARVRAMNGCTSATTPPTVTWHPELTGSGGCVEYTDCQKDRPVVFCTTAGFGHTDQHQLAIRAFSLFFDEASAPR
jgi:poly(3-hydroxybutyrate) depolymerase